MSKGQPASDARSSTVSQADLKNIVGDIDDDKCIAILELQPTVAELEEAIVWTTGDGDILAREGRPLTGVAAEVFEILTADEDEPPPVR